MGKPTRTGVRALRQEIRVRVRRPLSSTGYGVRVLKTEAESTGTEYGSRRAAGYGTGRTGYGTSTRTCRTRACVVATQEKQIVYKEVKYLFFLPVWPSTCQVPYNLQGFCAMAAISGSKASGPKLPAYPDGRGPALPLAW